MALFLPNYGHGSLHEGILGHKLEGMFKIEMGKLGKVIGIIEEYFLQGF